MEDIGAKEKTVARDPLSFLHNPPACRDFLEQSIVEIKEERYVKTSFPVKPDYCNPAGSMQGGIITAAFDNTFGPLSHIAMKSFTTTLHINTNFHAPIYPPDILFVEAEVVKLGKTVLYMRGEARNQEGKLIATADTTYMALKPKNKE